MESSTASKTKKKVKVPPVAGWDRGPKDFFRGSRGLPAGRQVFPKNDKSFIGFRRGSR